MSIFERIGRFLFPYRYAFDDENPEPRNYAELIERKHAEKQKKLNEMKKKGVEPFTFKGWFEKLIGKHKDVPGTTDRTEDKPPEPPDDVSTVEKEAERHASAVDKDDNLEAVERGELGIDIVEISAPMDTESACQRMKDSGSHIAYYYHDKDFHQLAVRFEPDSGWRYYPDERDHAARKKLKPLLFPRSIGPFDRTHVIPVGFHGSENDNRLLVGFNSDINRNALQAFENKVKKYNTKNTVMWFVDIQRQPDGSAKWHAHVWDDKQQEVISQTFHDKDKFIWL